MISGLNEENQMEGVDKTKEIAEKKVELEKAEKKLEELRSKYKTMKLLQIRRHTVIME